MSVIRHVGVRQDREPALLECTGKPSCGRWVKHVYVGDEVVGDEVAFAEIYQCTGCGARRRWGLLDKLGAAKAEREGRLRKEQAARRVQA